MERSTAELFALQADTNCNKTHIRYNMSWVAIWVLFVPIGFAFLGGKETKLTDVLLVVFLSSFDPNQTLTRLLRTPIELNRMN